MSQLDNHRSQDSATSALCSQWPINLKLTHLELNRETSLIHFQGHYLTTSHLDYSILQVEIQNTPKTKASVGLGEVCLVEDVISGLWYRGQVRNANEDTFDVFLIDHGNVLSVDISQMSSCSNDLLDLPPKIVCGFFSNVLPLHDCWDSVMEKYLLSLIGTNVTGYIHALLPHKVLIFEAPDINKEWVGLGFGKHVDTNTFLLLVQMLTDVPLEQNMERGPDFFQKTWGQNDLKSRSIKGLKEILSFVGTDMSAGTCMKLKVTAAVNPDLFHCQMSSAASDLQALSERMTSACNSTLSYHNRTPRDNLGLLCSVKGKDGKWYRGFVQCLPVNSKVKVLFVDYGFCESVNVENILRLPPNCLSVPIMAFPCALSSVTEHDKDWKRKQLCLLKKGILSGVLNAKILSLDAKLNIYSIEILSNEDCFVKEPELPQELYRWNHETVYKSTQELPQDANFCCETVVPHVLPSSVQAEGLKPGSKCVGYVVHVINPNDFSLRTQKRNSDFEDLMKQMSEHFSQVKLNEQVLENPQVGKMCCAMYELDMQFYRAVVKNKLDHGAVVLFIDFGNTEKVPYMLIKTIPEKFMSHPAFALSCTLGNIMPITDVWTSANSQFFRQTVLNRTLMVHVIQQRDYQIVVDLFTMESKTNENVTELLISSKQAESWKCTQSESIKQNTTKTTKWRPGKPKELCSLTQRQDVIPRDEKALVCQIKKMPVCTPTLKVTPKLQEPIVIKTLQLRIGSELPVRCTCIKCPSDFWCQMSDNLSALEELMAKIQLFYSTHTVPVPVGAIFCIAKLPEDGKWYRAFIVDRKSSSHISVRLVDNGTTLQVEEHKLQKILPEYSELEAQAFRCSLYNLIEPIDQKSCGEWRTEECTFVRDFVQEHSVSLTCSLTSLLWVTGKGIYTVVDLHCSQLQHSITELLIGQGLARPVKIQSKCSSSAFPISFSYSSFNLGCGSNEHVYITHVSNAWEIYCQLDKNSKIIEELDTKISEEGEKIHGVDASVDGMCLAKYFDGRWYRGLAKPVQSSLYFNVFFVDYGNTSIVEKVNVLSIPSHSAELLYTPMQAVRCTLARVPKLDPLAWVTQWLKKTLLNELVRAVVVGKLEDGTLTVELFNGDVHINNKVNEHIDNLSQKKGDHTPVSSKPKAVIKSKSFNSQQQTNGKKDERVSPTLNTTHSQQQDKRVLPTINTTHRQKQDKRVLPTTNTTHSQQQDKRVLPTVNTIHSQQKDKRVLPTTNTTHSQQQDRKVLPTINTTKENQIPKMPTPSSFPNPKPGLKALCYVSHINTAGDFFLQLQEEETNILNMREVLNSSVSRASLTSTQRELEIDDCVLAEYDDDGAVYRAIIKGSEQNGFKVEFLDYGNHSVVRKNKIYSLTGKLIDQPRLSIPCSLLNTSDYEEDSTFRDAITDKPLRVEFVCWIDKQWKVKIQILEEIACFSDPVPDSAAEPSEPAKQEVNGLNLSSYATKARLIKPSCLIKEVHKPQEVMVSTKDQILVPESSDKPTKSKMCLQEPETSASSKSCRPSDSSDMRDIVDAFIDLNPIARETKISEITNFKDEQARLGSRLPQQLYFAPINRGQVYYGSAAAVISPFDFFIICEDSFLIMNEVSAMLDELPNEMPPLPEAQCVPGSCCLVFSTTKGRWCRAEVVHAEATVVINLVDYGNYLYLAYSSYQVKILPEALKRLPKVTYPCSLRGVNPVSETRQWTDEAAVFFQESVCHKDLQIVFWEFVSDDQQWEVDILVDGIYLSKKLVKAGHSSYRDLLLGLRFEDQHLGNVSPLMASCMENSWQEVCTGCLMES